GGGRWRARGNRVGAGGGNAGVRGNGRYKPYRIISSPVSSPEPSRPKGYQNMYAHRLWMQQRFYAGLLLVVGLGSTAIAIYQGQLMTTNFAAFIIYVPLGLLLVAGFLVYRWRSKVQVLDSGVKISNTLRSVTIDYDNIR